MSNPLRDNLTYIGRTTGKWYFQDVTTSAVYKSPLISWLFPSPPRGEHMAERLELVSKTRAEFDCLLYMNPRQDWKPE